MACFRRRQFTSHRRLTPGRKLMDNDILRVDEFLRKWDRFAQGENRLVAAINQMKCGFEVAMAKLFRDRDPRAPSRLVFYTVVQIGGFIDADSELGAAAKPILGDNFKTRSNDGTEIFFAGDLYFWWLDHQHEFVSFPLLDEWQRGDFAKSFAIPMYSEVRRNQ